MGSADRRFLTREVLFGILVAFVDEGHVDRGSGGLLKEAQKPERGYLSNWVTDRGHWVEREGAPRRFLRTRWWSLQLICSSENKNGETWLRIGSSDVNILSAHVGLNRHLASTQRSQGCPRFQKYS
jgi:hypothetical protein